MDDVAILVKKLDKEAKSLSKGSKGAGGLDIYANETLHIPPGRGAKIKTGIALAIPEDHVGLIEDRSGISTGNLVEKFAGVIDSDYRGEVKVFLFNNGPKPFKVEKGKRIAQIVVTPCITRYRTVSNLDSTVRGGKGFGSTGED